MQISKRHLSIVALAAFAALAGCSKKDAAAPAASGAKASSGDVVEVALGTVGPISGGIAHIGKDVENAVRFAVDEFNATNPVIGGKKVRIKLMAEDDAGEPKQATAVAQKFCDSKVVGVVGHLQSGTSIPASKIYHDCGIPMITASATNPDLTKNGYNNVFRIIANDNQLGVGVVEQAAKMGVKTAVIIDDRTALGQGLASVFKETAAKNNIQILDAQFTNDKATDFQAILTAIKGKNPDAIFYGGLDSQAGPMLRQMDQLGMKNVKMFGGDAICTPKLPTLAGNAPTVTNAFCATGGAELTKMAGGQEWKGKYDAKYGKDAYQIYGVYGYDAARTLLQAMKEADSTDPAKYLPKLQAIKFPAIVGDISFTDKGELQKPVITLYTFKDGQRVELAAK